MWIELGYNYDTKTEEYCYMFATQIRPVTDLRNRYPEVESDLELGPVVLNKNGYGASVLVSIELYES